MRFMLQQIYGEVASGAPPITERSPGDIRDGLGEKLGSHHRLHAVRAHLLEMAGDNDAAFAEFRAAAAGTDNLREQRYLTTKAARMRSTPD